MAHLYWSGMKLEDEAQVVELKEGDLWPDWVAQANAPGPLRDALERNGLLPLASHITEGMPEEDVDWTTPRELIRAARALQELLRERNADAAPLLAGFSGSDFTPAELHEHLDDLVQQAERVAARGQARVTTCVNF